MLSERTPRHSAALIAGLLTLTACGYQLRGVGLDLADAGRIYVQIPEASTELALIINQTLKTAGVQFASDTETAHWVLRVHHERKSRRTAIMGPDGRPLEYELHYALDTSLLDDERVQFRRQIDLFRQYRLDPGKALSQDAEEATLEQEMRKEAVLHLVRQLQSLPANPATGASRDGR